MNKLLLTSLLFLITLRLYSQAEMKRIDGAVSFISSKNVYVKFESTDNIKAGDTLYIERSKELVPVLLVNSLSSISCVCSRVSDLQLTVNQPIVAIIKSETILADTTSKTIVIPEEINPVTDTIKKETPVTAKMVQNITGRISVSAYSNFSTSSDFSQRMRYSFSLNAKNIKGTGLSAESYISFVHKSGEWSEVKNDIFNGLKIYSLAANYAFNKNNNISIGRKINPHISNAGAIDGIQYEYKFKSFTSGVFAGSRPDYLNYGFNANLIQYGAYIGHDMVVKSGNMQNSLAFIEQHNSGNIDRRFAYFQHSNSLIPSLYFFGSFEVDLFNKKWSSADSTFIKDNKLKFSNTYFSVRYKINKQLSLLASYSNRQNIIYYETYKNIVEQLLETASTQGFNAQVNYRFLRAFTLGANAGYRYRKTDAKPSKNLYVYLTHNNIPALNATVTVSATLLDAVYISGRIYSIGLNRDLYASKLNLGLSYRYVDYRFPSAETPLKQSMGELNLAWHPVKKISVSLNVEGTFEKNRNFERVYINLIKRF